MRQSGLLLALVAALAGFFLLLNLLVPLVSTGPQDILAVKPSDEDAIRLPSGVALLSFGVAAMSIVLGVGALLALQARPLQRDRVRPSPRLPLISGVLAAVTLIGLGAYLAFSGTLGQGISYEQHQADRSLLQPIGLTVLAGFFLSVAIGSILYPRLLLPILGGWLAVGMVFGLLNTQSLDGLRLVEKASRLEEPVEYNALVERYLRVDEGKESGTGSPTSSDPDALDAEGAPGPAPGVAVGYFISLDPGVTVEQAYRLAHEPIFSVAGAANTSYLRAATGDIYVDGRWAQLDPVYIPVYADTKVSSRVAEFVSTFSDTQSSTQAEHSLNMAVLKPSSSLLPEARQDVIAVSPTGDITGFVAGSLAISQNLRSTQVDATYRPFSATLSVDQPLTYYGWTSSIEKYSPQALIEASPVDDPSYLQLPDGLPQRVHDLAAEIATDESVYLRARAVELYLQDNYTLAFAQPGSEPERPPAGQDPVDWFLFDHGEGSHGNFSTAFVVLARAAGVPARVVSGWAISASAQQTVHWDQAHQWAEIALDGLGWITFDPTPSESRGERAPSSETVPSSEGAALGETGPLKDKGDSIAPPPAQDPEAGGAPVTEEEVEAALEDLIASEDPQVRTFVSQVLGESADPEPLLVLIGAMVNEGEVGDRLEGVTALETLDLDLLIWILLNYQDPAIRVAVADALGDLGDLRALEALSQALATDLFPGVRGAAAAALAALGDASASGPLSRAVESDGNGIVRAAAAEALGVLKPPETTAVLIKALVADPDERVRVSVARALGRIRDDAALAPLLETEKHADLSAVREAARYALSEWPVFALVAALQASSLPEARAAAAEILGRLGYSSSIPALSRALGDWEEAVRSAALEALHRLGTMLPLENGGALLIRGETQMAFIPGATTVAAPQGPVSPAFEVSGAAGIKLLRTATGDHYVGGRWIPEESIGAPHRGQEIDHTPALVQPRQSTDRSDVVLSMPDSVSLLGGTVPTSAHLRTISLTGVFWPASAVYTTSASPRDYTWTSWLTNYSAGELESSLTAPSDLHTSLTGDLPQRVRDLAVEITAQHSGPYRKAAAIERHLKENYTYAQADATPEGQAEGHDPVDWFLFESKVGASGNFSSAFVVLARSVGIPARVVSGWAIVPMPDSQEVYSDQAHQWAEVPFLERGWVPFDPTPGGAPSRAAARLGSSDPEVRAAAIKGQLEHLVGSDAPARVAAREVQAGVLNSISDKHSSTLREVSATADAARQQAGYGASAPHGEALRLLDDLLDSVVGQSPTDAANSLARLESLVRDLSNLDQAQRERALSALAKLLESLTGDGLTAPARSQEALGDLLEVLSGSAVTIRLETGGVLIRQGRAGGQGQSPGYSSFSVGTGAYQATEPPHIPMFEVRGAANAVYLRTGVGDIYEDGRWAQQNPVSTPYSAGKSTDDLLRGIFYTPARDDLQLPSGPFEPALLFGPQTAALNTARDRIVVLPTEYATRLPVGPMPTSLTVQSLDRSGVFYPYSATFSSETAVASYSWMSSLSSYSDQQLARAKAVYGLAYTDPPHDLPGRIRTLAQRIATGHATAYGKAKALEHYLRTEYTYSFARSPAEGRPPPGRDPVDWFLFDHREGTCGVFSSAFVVLARSIGLPARVVSGWVIAPTANTQIVYADQAHQWAEVAFEGLGWVSFEPTASGGAPSRVGGTGSTSGGSASGGGSGPGGTTSGAGSGLGGGPPDFGRGPEVQPPRDTVTTITQWPAEIPRQQRFVVGGTVNTVGGTAVHGVTVEVYVNETKEHGGTKIGTTVTRFGIFQASVEIPVGMELGSYQLLARAVANDDFNESWSDPDITVFSSSGLELTGPADVPVDVEAIFHGKVSDDAGQGVADRQLNVTIDGRAEPPVTTSPTGTFSFSRSFSDPGRHWVAVEVKGQEYLLDNQVRLDFQVTLPTVLTLLAPALVSVSEDFTVNGELRDARGEPLSSEYVSVRVGDNPEVRTLTDGSGAFQFDGRTDSAGEFVVQANFSGLAPTLPSEETTRLTARHMVSLSLTGPSQIDTGSGALFTGRLTSDTLSPIGELEISIEDGEGSQLAAVTTDEDGRFEYNHASFDIAGRYSLTARFPGGEFVAPRSARVNFAVVSPTTLTIAGPAVQTDGQLFEVTGVVMQGSGAVFTGRLASDTVSPIGRRELSIRDSNGRELATVTTSEDGVFDYKHPSFDTAGSHSLTVRFSGGESLGPQSASITFGVLSPTTLTIKEPATTGAGHPVEAAGFLLQGSGAVFTGRLASATVSPIGQREISLRDGNGRALATVTTSEDGTFEYEHPAFEATGPHSLTIRFSGTDFLAAQSTGITFGVLALTALTLEELSIVREGEPFALRGVLRRGSGLPVANATVRVTSDGSTSLVTDADGRFAWEATGRLNESSADAALESEFDVEVLFEGTDHLAPAIAGTTVIVGVPRIIMEPVDTVARGDSVRLRGTALIGTHPISELQISIGENTTVHTNEAGVFNYTYPVTENAPLGITEVAIAADAIAAGASVAIEVKSAPNLTVAPVDKVRPGRATVLRVTLVDDQGTEIAQATLRSSQGAAAVTDAEGVALMDLTVPDSHELPSIPITFNYDGDDLNMPLSYFLGVPITPTSFNWLLWAGAPVTILLVIAAVLAGRRVGTVPLPVLVRQRLATLAPAPEPVAVPVADSEEPTDEEVIDERQPARLGIRFMKPAHDLPDVWGIGEEVAIEIELADHEGQAIRGATLAVSVSGGGPGPDLVADDAGLCTLHWTPTELGEYVVSASFAGDDERLEASAARSLRVVDFREEIVRLYNEFLDWAEKKTPAISEQSTPREVELTIVAEGLLVDQKSLDELISRFEEADYSEHPIARRHYERMYRAWQAIVRD